MFCMNVLYIYAAKENINKTRLFRDYRRFIPEPFPFKFRIRIQTLKGRNNTSKNNKTDYSKAQWAKPVVQFWASFSMIHLPDGCSGSIKNSYTWPQMAHEGWYVRRRLSVREGICTRTAPWRHVRDSYTDLKCCHYSI